MINNGLEGSLEKVARGIDSKDKRDIGAGIKVCVAENARIEEVETAKKEEQQVGGQTVTMQDDNSLVDDIRGDMGDGR